MLTPRVPALYPPIGALSFTPFFLILIKRKAPTEIDCRRKVGTLILTAQVWRT